MRWPVRLPTSQIVGQRLTKVDRRAKYLLFLFDSGALIIHLGMSGRLRIVPANSKPRPHDHVDLVFDGERVLRLNDARRFGSVHWQARDTVHWLLADLGPEPLSEDFSGDYLFEVCKRRKAPIKSLLMNARIVVGVGNIYVNESLFRARIRPRRSARRLTKSECIGLVQAVKVTLQDALEAGGTTLRDYVDVEGEPGYFRQELNVYGREGKPCYDCGSEIKSVKSGQRQTVYCPKCQK